MRRIGCIVFIIACLSMYAFADSVDLISGIEGTVPETLFVNGINNVLFSPDEPIVFIDEAYYLPVSPQFLSRVGLVPVWDEAGRMITLMGMPTGSRLVEKDKSDRYLVAYKRPVQVLACEPIKVQLQESGQKLSLDAVYKDKASEIWYIPLTKSFARFMDWEFHDMGPYGQYLYLYNFTDEEDADFLIHQSEMQAMAKYMTIINKRLDIERAAYYVQLVEKTSQKYDIDKMWIFAMMWQESWYDESCTYINAVGMMQMLRSTGASMGVTPDQLLNPAINIDVCVKYLSRDLRHFDGDLEKAILAYNQGSFRVDKGTHRTWYYEEVSEKYAKIDAYIQKKVAGL